MSMSIDIIIIHKNCYCWYLFKEFDFLISTLMIFIARVVAMGINAKFIKIIN